jgi:hypothetical protein
MERLSQALRFCLLPFFACALATQGAAAAGGRVLPQCASAHILFDISSIEQIFLRPEAVLANADRFWEEDGAYRLAKLWHERNNIPIPYDEWRENLKRIVRTPAAERSSSCVCLGQGLRGQLR